MSAPLFKPAPPSRQRRSRRWLTPLVIFLLVAGIIGTLAKPTYVAYALTHPARKALQEQPKDYGLAYEDVQFPSAQDGTILRGWYLPATTNSTRTVVLSHGYKNNRVSEKIALPLAKELTSKGFNVLAFDYRDSGESDGQMVTVGLHEQFDLLGAVRYVRSRGATKVGLHGWSMGAANVVLAMAQDPSIAAGVADSAFSDLHSYLSDNLPVWSKLSGVWTPYMLAVIRTVYGTDDRQVSPVQVMPKIQAPVLFIHSDGDPSIPKGESEKLLAAAKNPSDQLWLIHYAKHATGYFANPQEYLNRVTDFFGQNLR